MIRIKKMNDLFYMKRVNNENEFTEPFKLCDDSDEGYVLMTDDDLLDSLFSIVMQLNINMPFNEISTHIKIISSMLKQYERIVTESKNSFIENPQQIPLVMWYLKHELNGILERRGCNIRIE